MNMIYRTGHKPSSITLRTISSLQKAPHFRQIYIFYPKQSCLLLPKEPDNESNSEHSSNAKTSLPQSRLLYVKSCDTYPPSGGNNNSNKCVLPKTTTRKMLSQHPKIKAHISVDHSNHQICSSDSMCTNGSDNQILRKDVFLNINLENEGKKQ
ncbi:unnamed protein product [Didymodactylos carnosus]|uniref:Uncharacterized protein n=1 Tax=Didymodactylos carnosus TaxID=1234261 RepID=A0A813R8R8_9BILA|nr:unnamed protein product [Didymodactylos carnosus]CAF0779114.1 unnamed protein product [Didymodactylos carnosus]CAF3494088.1 unnamed protein product [Didymodactylos carnosus]CAF3562073.1 unnamed protein product [Didymodactylos carnosus]